MRLSTARVGATALAVAVSLLVAGCSTDAEPEAAPETTASETPEEQAQEPAGPTEVPDVTLLILETALGNLMRAGLEVETVDADGQPVTVDDATAYKVVAQDPEEGVVEPGQTVTLTVEPRG
jgi:ABC-type Fe3+-hydroxamate transport system substrate-binding protein